DADPNETITVTLGFVAGLFFATGTTVSGSGTTTLTLSGSLADVNADLATLSLQAGIFDGNLTVKTKDGDGAIGSYSIYFPVNQPPALHVASTELAMQQGHAQPLGISVSDFDNSGELFAFSAADTSGLLSATANGQAIVSGSGTTHLTITGTLVDLDNTLQTLTYVDNAFGTDTIDIAVSDHHNGSDHRQVAVDSNAMPSSQLLQSGVMTALPGMRFADADPNETITVTLGFVAGLFFATGTTVSGSGTTTLTLSGSLADVNADLATLSLQAGIFDGNLTVKTKDGDGAIGSYSIYFPVNQPPVLHVASTELAMQQWHAQPLGISVSDFDSSGELFAFSAAD